MFSWQTRLQVPSHGEILRLPDIYPTISSSTSLSSYCVSQLPISFWLLLICQQIGSQCHNHGWISMLLLYWFFDQCPILNIMQNQAYGSSSSMLQLHAQRYPLNPGLLVMLSLVSRKPTKLAHPITLSKPNYFDFYYIFWFSDSRC